MVALTHWVSVITACVLAPGFNKVFRSLVRQSNFPACWRQANVTPIPKGPPSSSVANYRLISITSVLSKVFQRLVSVRLGRFVECSGVLPTTQFAYQKGLVPVMRFCACPIHSKVLWRVIHTLNYYTVFCSFLTGNYSLIVDL